MRLRSTAPMRTAKVGYIVMSLALCAFGIVLIVLPDISAKILGIVCGVIASAFGCVRLVCYFSKDLYRLAFQYDLPLGILLIVLGVIMLTRPDSLMTFICVSTGLYILTDSLFRMRISAEARRFGIREWWLILALAIVTAVCGLLLLIRPGDGSRLLVVLLGISLLAEGIMSLSTVLTAVKIIRHQQPDVIEAEWTEE